MTVSQASQMIWNMGYQVMQLEIPFFQYEISFWQILIFGMIVTILMRLINKPLERNDDD